VPLYQFRDGYVRSLELRGGHTTFHIKSLLSTVHISDTDSSVAHFS